MIEIPKNTYFDDEAKVEELNAKLYKEYQESESKTFFGVSGCSKYPRNVIMAVLKAWKAQEWHCYYLERFDGVIIGVQVFAYDYQPNNSGVNKLIKY